MLPDGVSLIILIQNLRMFVQSSCSDGPTAPERVHFVGGLRFLRRVELLVQRSTSLEAASSADLVPLLGGYLLIERALTYAHRFEVLALVLHSVIRKLRSKRSRLDFRTFSSFKFWLPLLVSSCHMSITFQIILVTGSNLD